MNEIVNKFLLAGHKFMPEIHLRQLAALGKSRFKNPDYDRHQRGRASTVYKFFDKKSSGSDIKNKNISNKELAEELHKPII